MWLLLIVSIVHSSAPFGGPVGVVTGTFSDLFYSDPRRLSAVVTLLITPMAGIALFTLAAAAVRGAAPGGAATRARAGYALTAALLVAASVGLAWHYFPRHRYLIGEKYDQVMVDDKDFEAFALPRDAARGTRHPDRQRQHRRHGVDVRGRRPAPAVDALRLSAAAGARAITDSSSGPTPTTPTPIRGSPRRCRR